jgi:thiamine-phosphate pyrophosphorylase
MKRELYRIIDANFNRSREGLRVCEEVARFVKGSRPLTSGLKSARHAISDVLKNNKATARILRACRDTKSDVGRCSCSVSEMDRLTYDDIFGANIQRVKESLRVLEEFFKLVDRKSSARLSRIRFKVYEIEKKALK